MFDLKPLRKDAVPAALEKAMRYRLLSEPAEAESICLDIIRADPENQEALVTLLLALTDQLGDDYPRNSKQARELLDRIRDPFERTYYAGIICERQAKAQLVHNSSARRFHAHDLLTEAMALFERADAIRPPGNDDARLRWNTCARIIMRYQLGPREGAEPEHPLE